jgi:hypothetical protein
MRRYALCAVLALMSSAVAQGPASKPLSPFEQQLIAVQQQFLQANIDKNATQVNQTVTEDFRGIATNGDLYNREDIISDAREGLPKTIYPYDFHVIKLGENCAVVAYDLIVPGEQPRYRHMADTWSQISGQWKLKFQQITPNLWSAKDFD